MGVIFAVERGADRCAVVGPDPGSGARRQGQGLDEVSTSFSAAFRRRERCGSPAGGIAFKNPIPLMINLASFSCQVHPPGWIRRARYNVILNAKVQLHTLMTSCESKRFVKLDCIRSLFISCQLD